MVEQVQAATAATRPKEKAGGRALALDALKGVIMVVMALDHTRSFLMKYDGVKEIWYAPATYNPQIWDFVSRYVFNKPVFYKDYEGFDEVWRRHVVETLKDKYLKDRAGLRERLYGLRD